MATHWRQEYPELIDMGNGPQQAQYFGKRDGQFICLACNQPCPSADHLHAKRHMNNVWRWIEGQRPQWSYDEVERAYDTRQRNVRCTYGWPPAAAAPARQALADGAAARPNAPPLPPPPAPPAGPPPKAATPPGAAALPGAATPNVTPDIILAEFRRMREDMARQAREITSTVDTVVGEVKAIKEEIGAVKEQLRTVFENLEGVVQTSGAAAQDVEVIKGDVAKIKGDVETAKGDVKAIAAQVDSDKLDTDVEAIMDAVETVKRDVETVKGDVGKVMIVSQVAERSVKDVMETLKEDMPTIKERLTTIAQATWIMAYDPKARISARKAKEHPYFRDAASLLAERHAEQ